MSLVVFLKAGHKHMLEEPEKACSQETLNDYLDGPIVNLLDDDAELCLSTSGQQDFHIACRCSKLRGLQLAQFLDLLLTDRAEFGNVFTHGFRPITPNVEFSGPPGPYHQTIDARRARAGPLERMLGLPWSADRAGCHDRFVPRSHRRSAGQIVLKMLVQNCSVEIQRLTHSDSCQPDPVHGLT